MHVTEKVCQKYIIPVAFSYLNKLYVCVYFRHRLIVGLARLSEANALVGTMQEELVALGPKIEEKAKVK